MTQEADPIYDEVYHARYAEVSYKSALEFMPKIRHLVINKIMSGEKIALRDIGCGPGSWIKAAQDYFKHELGFTEGFDPNLPRKEFLDMLYKDMPISRDDILLDTEPPLSLQPVDVTLCLEVAEHIEEALADKFIKRLCESADPFGSIVFSAAIPGQGGEGHINEQWPEYWAEKFAANGFYLYEDPREEIWKNEVIAPWYRQNILIYRKWNGNSPPPYVIPEKKVHHLLWKGMRKKLLAEGLATPQPGEVAEFPPDARRCDPSAAATAKPPRTVFFGFPCGTGHSDAFSPETVALCAGSRHEIIMRTEVASALTANFNSIWCKALNMRKQAEIDYFVMLHNDVTPIHPNWIDKLVDLIESTDADVLSCIIPIKDERGVTSTAFDTDPWAPRRLTMHEAFQLPETWTMDTIHQLKKLGSPALDGPIGDLLINTGLWIAKFTQPWIERVCFDIENQIYLDEEDGLWKVRFESEDWKFGRWCNANGVKLAATRAIQLSHSGYKRYHNWTPWGKEKTDTLNIKTALKKAGKLLDTEKPID